jgi:hypothetical protein
MGRTALRLGSIERQRREGSILGAAAHGGWRGAKTYPTGQVTVHIGGLEQAAVQSCTPFVPAGLLDRLKVQRGDLVYISGSAVRVGSEYVWVVDKIEFLVN